MKKVWLSILSKDEQAAQKIMGIVKSYGLEPDGHFWTDNIEKSSWMGARPELLNKEVALWMILGTSKDLAEKSVRYGLSLLSLAVQAQRGHGFPLIILHPDGDPVSVASLPTPLRHAEVLPASSATLGAKLVARANTPFKPTAVDYRIDVYGLAGLGTWVEVGPAKGPWKGIIFGVSPGDIDAHGVGPKGELPKDKMVLNYPQKGLKLNLGEKEYTAWAVQNDMDQNSSYFVRVREVPESFLFGEFSGEDQAEMFVLQVA